MPRCCRCRRRHSASSQQIRPHHRANSEHLDTRTRTRIKESLIQRTTHPMSPTIEHVGIDLRRAHILVPEQLLNRANVIAALQ